MAPVDKSEIAPVNKSVWMFYSGWCNPDNLTECLSQVGFFTAEQFEGKVLIIWNLFLKVNPGFVFLIIDYGFTLKDSQ